MWSVFGKVNYWCRYYHCPHCLRCQPLPNELLGLTSGQITPGLASLLGILGAETSIEEASQLAERFLLYSVSDNTVRKQTEGYGKAQAIRERNGNNRLKIYGNLLQEYPGGGTIWVIAVGYEEASSG